MPRTSVPRRKKLPLHNKNVPTINLDAMDALDAPVAAKDLWTKMKEWLTNPEKYRMVPRDTSDPRLKISRADAKAMIGTGKLVRCAREDVLNFVNFFTVEEIEKGRRRAIEHPVTINDTLDRSTTVLPTREDIELQSTAGACAIPVDFQSWFDQLPLDPAVQPRFGVMGNDGSCYMLTRLPMGFRHAPAVAVAATDLIRSMNTCSSQSCIDNVRFVGNREEVIAETKRFMERVKSVGALLNEQCSPEDLVQEKGD